MLLVWFDIHRLTLFEKYIFPPVPIRHACRLEIECIDGILMANVGK